MSSRSVRAVAVLAVFGLLASGCAQQVPGLGSYSSGRIGVADAKVAIENTDNGEIDKLAGNAIADIEKFWTEQMPEVFNERYDKVKAYYSVDPDGSRAAPCTDKASDIRGNAFYCPSRDVVAWDRKGLFPELQSKFGDFLVAMVLAHEWGHAIQKRTRMPSNKTIVVETQADCYAGAWTQYALKGGAPHFEIERPVLDQALSGYLLFRDPLGSDQDDRQAHGSGFDRVSGFQDGFEKGAKFCTDFSDSRTFTQIRFGSAEDEKREGNLPFNDAWRLGTADLAEYWEKSFRDTFNQDWKPLAGIEQYSGDQPGCQGTESTAVRYCPGEDKIVASTEALTKVYEDTGDFGMMSMLAIAYGQAVRKRIGKPVNGDSALLGSICLAGGYARDSFDKRRSDAEVTLSPGDLDEAVQTLLTFVGRQTGYFVARSTTGFDRVSAYRAGFNDLKTCP